MIILWYTLYALLYVCASCSFVILLPPPPHHDRIWRRADGEKLDATLQRYNTHDSSRIYKYEWLRVCACVCIMMYTSIPVREVILSLRSRTASRDLPTSGPARKYLYTYIHIYLCATHRRSIMVIIKTHPPHVSHTLPPPAHRTGVQQ